MISLLKSTHPLKIQFALQSLETFPVDVVFFYIPQIVQALRDDSGYVMKYILETARCVLRAAVAFYLSNLRVLLIFRVSQLFSHQILWNMNANMNSEEQLQIVMTSDLIRQPIHLDYLETKIVEIRGAIVNALSGVDKDFYEREFTFFSKITGISGLLKSFIKKSKQEKKVFSSIYRIASLIHFTPSAKD